MVRQAIRFLHLRLPLCLIGLAAQAAIAAEWPQWRGPERDGQAPGDAWSQTLSGLQPSWRVALGKGYPGPVVTTDKVYVVETVDRYTVGVRALSRDTGALLWRTTWDGSGSVPFFARANGDWVRSTPAWDGSTLFVGDMSEVLVALDGETGVELWRVDFPDRYGTPVPDFGFASSPLVAGSFVFIQAANSLVKLDKHTGHTVWRRLEIDTGIASNGAFSSPVLTTLAGTEQLIALNRHALHGVEASGGRVLWNIPLPHFRGMHILTPLVWGEAIFTSPYRERSYRIDIAPRGGGMAATTAWTNKSSGNMSSPVVIGDHAYIHLGNTRVECIDLASGRSTWRSERRFGKYWSMVWRDGQILALDSDGVLFLMAANPERFELRAERVISSQETWGHLAVSGDGLFVRELEAIAAWRWFGDGSTAAD